MEKTGQAWKKKCEQLYFSIGRSPRLFASLVLAFFVGLSVFAAFSVPHLKTEYSVRQFMPAGHPLTTFDDKVKQRFQLVKIEPFFALVTLGDGDWLTESRMSRLKAVTERLKPLDGVDTVISLATMDGASSSKEGLTVGPLLELTPQPEWAKRILEDPLLTPALITKDARTVLVLVGMKDISTAQYKFIQNETKRTLQEAFPESKVALGGIPAVQTQMGDLLGAELKNFLGLSLLCSVITLLLFFRTFSSVALPLILMVMANLISLAWMVWTGVSFTVLSTTLPVLVSITVVSMSMHTMMRYAADWERALQSQVTPSPIVVLLRSYQGLLLPNFLTAVTTSIGFFAIAVGRIPLIRQYGITVGASIFVCWFVVIGALLPLMILFPIPSVRSWANSRARWALYLTKYKWQTVALVSSITLAFFWVGKDLQWSAQLFDDLPQKHEARASTDFIDSSMGGMVPLDIVVEKEEEDAWNDPASIQKLDELAAKWRSDPAVGSVNSASDLFRTTGRLQGRDLPSTRKEAAESAFLYSFSSPSPLKQFVTSDGRATRISLRLHDIPGDAMAKLVADFTKEAQAAFPGWKVQAAGMATTVHVLNNELCQELIYGFWQAIALIGLFLWFAFGSLRWTLISIVPNLVSPAVLLGSLTLFHTPIKPGIALIFSIALGISFDNTVYLLGRLKLLKDRSGRVSIERAWHQEANLCLFSSLALSAGFLVFLASYFALNRLFGAYMLVSIFGGLLGDLILLPALLAAFPWMVGAPKQTRRSVLAKEDGAKALDGVNLQA